MNGMSALIKGISESSCSVSTMVEYNEKSATRRQSSPEPDHGGTLILNFQPPKLSEIKVLFKKIKSYKSISLITKMQKILKKI